MLKDFYKKHQSAIEKADGLLVNNTVLERGLVLAPVIVAATSVQNSLILGISFVLLTFFTLLLASFVPKKFPYTIRVIIYVLLACLLYLPVSAGMDRLFPESVYKVGIFLPLLVTNSLIVTKSETRFLRETRPAMLLDVLCYTLGFFLAILPVGALRELFGNGTLLGNPVQLSYRLSVLLLPFGGFILVGFLAALVQRFRLYLLEPEKEKKSRFGRRRQQNREGK